MKRFTETLKWQDPWFRRLSANAKMLWLYILDHADHIGLVEVDVEFVSQDCCMKIADKHIAELGDRLEKVSGCKYYMPKFIRFQYGSLSESCPAHKKVLQSIKNDSLFCDSLGYHYPNARVSIPYRTVQEEDRTGQEGNKTGEPEEKTQTGSQPRGTLEELKAYALEIGLPASDGSFMFDHWSSNGWKNGENPSKDWKAGMRKWKTMCYLPSQKGNPTPPKQQPYRSCL